MKVLGLLPLFCLAGCVLPYPVYKTLQPEAQATVSDSLGHPVVDAEVVIISNAYPYGFEQFRVSKQTDQNGVAVFPSRKEWRTEALVIHGSQVFFWNWCIKKDGYETYVTRNRSARLFERRPKIVLEQGVSVGCPDKFGNRSN
jgi:hypothetical protein